MSMEVIHTNKAPDAIGPYEQAIKANGFVYTAGQIALVPESGELVAGGVENRRARSSTTSPRFWKRPALPGTGLSKRLST